MLELLKERFTGYKIVELDEDFFNIVNPFGKGNIGVYEDKTYTIVVGEEWRKTPPSRVDYIIRFNAQHRHFSKAEDAIAYIASIINDEVCSVEISAKTTLCLSGDIAASRVQELTLDTLSKKFRTTDFLRYTEVAVRSFSGKFDRNGSICRVGGKYTLIWE